MSVLLARECFPYPILASESFDASLRGTGSEQDFETFAYAVVSRPRTLLQARGGAGKTWTAQRIATFVDSHVPVAFIEAVSLIDILATEAPHVPGSDLDQLIARALPNFDPDHLQATRWGVIIIDGLNEIPAHLVDVLFAGLAHLYARHPHVSVLVTDRLTRRNVDPERWALATLGPVPDEQAREIAQLPQGEEVPEFLTVPYYLDKYTFDAVDNVATLHSEYFARHAGLNASQILDLSEFAYLMYLRDKDTVFEWDDLVKGVGESPARALLASGIIEGSPTRFAHHLTHDYLAAFWLATHDELWVPEGFDALTLDGASFDALGLVVAQLPQVAIDDFVCSVFDWSLYAAGLLLEEDSRASRSIQAALRTAIVSSLAEKKFDNILGTAQRATDILRIQASELSDAMLRQTSLRGVSAVMAQYAPARHPEWFDDWRERFEHLSGPLAGDIVGSLESDNSLIGWATSNALCRVGMDRRLQGKIIHLSRSHESSSVRCRCVHALSFGASADSVRALLGALDGDPVRGVRYGALRSLLVRAARSEARVRGSIIHRLGERSRVQRIVSEPSLLAECLRCLELLRPPEGWHESAGDLLQDLWTLASRPADREMIADAARRMRGRSSAL